MAASTALTLLGRPRAVPGRLGGSRGIPTRIIQDVGDALAPCIEGIAFAQDVIAGVERIVMAAAAGSRHAVVNEAGKPGHRAVAERDEFRRLAGEIEGPDGGMNQPIAGEPRTVDSRKRPRGAGLFSFRELAWMLLPAIGVLAGAWLALVWVFTGGPA